jgi:sugar phosphate permease
MAYIIAFPDRTNIGLTIPTMSKDLDLIASVLGLISGILLLGYGISQSAGGWLAEASR